MPPISSAAARAKRGPRSRHGRDAPTLRNIRVSSSGTRNVIVATSIETTPRPTPIGSHGFHTPVFPGCAARHTPSQ